MAHAAAAALWDLAAAQPPSQWCQAVFLGAAGSLLVLQALPASLRGLLMDYGPRATTRQKQQPAPPPLQRLVGAATRAGQVPHAWFWHFYLLSVAASAFWAWQFGTGGRVLRALAERQQQHAAAAAEVGDDDALGRVVAAWAMMALQGTRRLYESLFVMRTGEGSSMWFVHWALGLTFYAVMSISIWIERSDAILASWETQHPARILASHILASRVPACLAVFLWAWTKQHACHAHLASLKKYTLPTAGLFRYLVCPHYTCECLVYLTIAFVAAPAGRWCSGPVLCGLAFVVANLGATAVDTRRWYVQKFGAEAVASRWTMIPFVF
ncbi:3-oxo-5-alpha-steroid 4-dehydrogenase [Cordyceps militaris]|uniref:Polyprenal reductase n=1 Tax=Cordyceps militaris TaxID=73501 RepID=A0A2H4SMM6_CORMI|nr:3-oxo-5-alpha-steroid 4-dehydrogenase [Cordyceps militaris]